jgi:hypothetical protein
MSHIITGKKSGKPYKPRGVPRIHISSLIEVMRVEHGGARYATAFMYPDEHYALGYAITDEKMKKIDPLFSHPHSVVSLGMPHLTCEQLVEQFSKFCRMEGINHFSEKRYDAHTPPIIAYRFHVSDYVRVVHVARDLLPPAATKH